ncbi:hypothetical protein AZE42_13724 [Rhizopogon vesiculosus]|uniref:Ricin B lectin domain-containing protein n=1 Tax=Rhizopogon vesiculosus TaxID=180088 RepID=A0A1J8R8T0_9AGAM|nr:hypothetical protein AZE42_13724 [Rhizopogon vesiculosus]
MSDADSIPPPGTYRLRNVKYPNQLFDLNGGSATDGTQVIGFANNSNTKNMLWIMQVVDELNNFVRLINAASGTFAFWAGETPKSVSNVCLYPVLF